MVVFGVVVLYIDYEFCFWGLGLWLEGFDPKQSVQVFFFKGNFFFFIRWIWGRGVGHLDVAVIGL